MAAHSAQAERPGSAALAAGHSIKAPCRSRFGESIWQSDPNLSPSSPARSRITSAKVAACQLGLQRQVFPPPWFVKLQCGGPPAVSILRTCDQPEEGSPIQPPPCGSNASTGISAVPPIYQATTGLTNDSQHTPHLVPRTTTTGLHTQHPVSVRTGQPHPAANRRRTAAWGLWFSRRLDCKMIMRSETAQFWLLLWSPNPPSTTVETCERLLRAYDASSCKLATSSSTNSVSANEASGCKS